MSRILLSASIAALALTAPAVAAPGHGGGAMPSMSMPSSSMPSSSMPSSSMPSMSMPAGGPSSTAIDARSNSQGAANADPRAIEQSSPNSALHTGTTTGTTSGTTGSMTTRSQGLEHASPTGIAHADSHSALARGSVAATSLPGLTTGLSVHNSTGTTIGTVSRVVTGTDGSIRLILVTSPTGQTIRVAPTTATISGGIVTTTGG